MRKNAIVTGAASGFGNEFSELLAKDSFNLILIDIDVLRLELVKQEILGKYSVDVSTIVCDLSSPESVDLIYNKIREKNIDILINCAGYGLFGHFSETDWLLECRMINLHVLNLTHLTKKILQRMIQSGSGRIMNVSSIAAFLPGPLMSVYYSTKAYILAFTESVASELKGTGVSITAFCPGQTKTNFQQTLAVLSNTKRSSTGFYMADLKQTAKYGYDAMMKGEITIIPGFINKIISQAPRVLPRRSTASIIKRLQMQIRK